MFFDISINRNVKWNSNENYELELFEFYFELKIQM